MIRDLYNVRLQSVEGVSTPLTDDEEQRMRAMLFGELGNEIADRGWVRFPAYEPEDRHAADRRSAPPQLSLGAAGVRRGRRPVQAEALSRRVRDAVGGPDLPPTAYGIDRVDRVSSIRSALLKTAYGELALKSSDMVDVTPANHRHSSIWFA